MRTVFLVCGLGRCTYSIRARWKRYYWRGPARGPAMQTDNPTPELALLWTVTETSQRLRITPRTLFKLSAPRGRLPVVRLGAGRGRVLYAPVDVAAFIESAKVGRANG